MIWDNPYGRLFLIDKELLKPELIITPFELANLVLGIMGAIGTAYGLYKAWRFAEWNMASRVDDFLKNEYKKLSDVRTNISNYRVRLGTPFLGNLKIRKNPDLAHVLYRFEKGNFFKIEQALDDAAHASLLREREALELAGQHKAHRAIAHVLHGARLVKRGEHLDALGEFNRALEINKDDAEALDFSGHQLIRLGRPSHALERFDDLCRAAQQKIGTARSNSELELAHLLLARAHRGRGLANENRGMRGAAYDAYTDAMNAFPSVYNAHIDLADIHQLRGRVALELGYTTQSLNSLTQAKQIFKSLIKKNGEVSDMARKGLALVDEALIRLYDLQSQNDDDNDNEEVLAVRLS